MLFLIFSVGVFALLALSIFLGVLKGGRYAWQYAAVRVANVIVSAGASIILSIVIGKVLGNVISKAVLNLLPSSLGSALGALPSASGIVGAFAAMILMPIIFCLLFTLIRGIIALFAPSIAWAMVGGKKKNEDNAEIDEAVEEKLSKRKRLKREKKEPLGMLLGGICGFLMFIVLVSPLTVYLNLTSGVIKIVGSGDNNPIAPVVEITDAVANNAGTKTVRVLGGDLLASGMTSYSLGGRTSNFVRETGVISAVGDAVYAVRSTSLSRVEAAKEVREVGAAIEKARLIPSACAEVFDSASSDWSNGGQYAGMNAVGTNGALGRVMKPIYAAFDGSTYDTFKEDARTIVNIVASLVEYDALGNIKSSPVSILKNEDATQRVIFELLDNERLSGTVSGVVDFGIVTMCEKLEVRNDLNGMYEELLVDLDAIYAGSGPLGEENIAKAEQEYADLFDKYGLAVEKDVPKKAALADVSGADMAKWLADEGIVSSQSDLEAKSVFVTVDDIAISGNHIEDKAAEAVRLASALSEVAVLVESMADDKDTSSLATDLGPLLDAFAQTETVGRECTSNLLIALLQSPKITGDVGYGILEATDLANTINDGALADGGYAIQMKALGRTVDIIKKASSDGDAKESISELLKELTPESAKTMQVATTPKVMKQNGVPDRSTVPASNMVSDMFGNLSDAKTQGMSDEKLEGETAAVNNVLNLAMNMDKSNSATFGEGSATGISAAEYVDDIMNSEVVSKTVVDHVYADGDEPKTDPLNSERAMSDQEKTELVEALDAKWQNASAEERADENFAKRIIATASLINVTVTVTDSGVVRA